MADSKDETGEDQIKTDSGCLGGERIKHPAMGLVTLHRVTCGGKGMSLFGTEVKHREYIEITLHEANVERELYSDWTHQERALVSFALSSAQFADMLLKINDGDGVPATITWSYGKSHKMPDIQSKAETFRHETKSALDRGLGGFNDAFAAVKTALEEGQPLTKKGLRETASRFKALEDSLSGTVPFIIEQFSEQMEKVVSDAKAEYDAFVQTSVDKLGVQAIKNGAPLLDYSRDPEASE